MTCNMNGSCCLIAVSLCTNTLGKNGNALETDAIQFLEFFKIVSCMYGVTFLISRELIPFSNCHNSRYENQ